MHSRAWGWFIGISMLAFALSVPFGEDAQSMAAFAVAVASAVAGVVGVRRWKPDNPMACTARRLGVVFIAGFLVAESEPTGRAPSSPAAC
jgi:hypothetical protein